ncbi:unnamed protein product [Lactuca virosa]|uniref:Uncharacterized protein n=1 Tax=Lactuca virosa TaxID=75947 RepID=A0AAU9P181_9ASTR|nr:unnamed protein product [Lactuca virosa]
MLLWIEHPYTTGDSQEASASDSEVDNDEYKESNFSSDSSTTSPYNSAYTELVLVPDQEIEIDAPSPIEFALVENDDEDEGPLSNPPI